MTQGAIGMDAELVAADRAERAGRARTILAQAALLGILGDATLRAGPTGLGWTTMVAGIVLTVVLLALGLRERVTRERAAWLAVAVAAAAASAWRDAGMLRLLNFAATIAAFVFAAMAFAGAPARSVIGARVRDLILAGRDAAFDAAGGSIALIRQSDAGALIDARGRAALPALRAALLTIPLLLVFGSLFAEADPVFAALFALPDIGLETVASHVLFGVLCAWLCGGWLRGTLSPASRSVPPDRLPFTLGMVEIGASLGALNALFATFVGLQARWLFGGASVVEATTGLTVAEYARRGFFELVLVAALVAPVILVTRALAADDETIRRHRALASTLIVLLFAVMTSAFLRMALYVSHFGLTTDRLYASVFMGWLAVAFAAMGFTLLRGWGKPFAAIAVISGFATLGALNAANPEAVVAHVNVARGEAGPRGVDYPYLARLGGDALPITARALTAAKPSRDACWAARAVYNRASAAPGGHEWNWGAVSGAAAAEALLTIQVVRRLCGHETPATGVSR